MYRFRELSIGWLVIFLSLTNAQDKGFNHELPPGVELINPKDLGLSDADLGKFLGNVKVLGGGQVGDTKTQILTVGFDGDENLNLDDFDIPGLTDKKGTNLAEKDKEIANVAFEKFKEFFKDPKKNGKSYDDATQRSLGPLSTPYSPTANSFVTPNNLNAHKDSQEFQKKIKESVLKYSPGPKPSAQTLQQHYPVTLTQPLFSTTSRPIQAQQSTYKVPVPTQQHPTYVPIQPSQAYPNQNSYNPNVNQNSYNPNTNPHTKNRNPAVRYQNQDQQNQNPISHQNEFTSQNYITPLIAAQNKLNAHVNQQIYQTITPPLEFGAKLPSTHAPVQKPFRENNQVQYDHQQHRYQHPPQASHPQQKQQQQQPKVQSSQSPPANYQNFNLFNPQNSAKQNRETEDFESIGKIVRNQLTFNSNSQPQTPHPQYFQNPQQHRQQAAPTQNQQQQSLSPSPSIPSPSIQRFPQDQQRPVSHVFIQHDKHSSPVQQTSFHPRFQPPTKFVNNFTPSAPRITTPSPRIEVTPSMPMILLSTNENAITDPDRMERLRQQQRHREELRLRELQRQSHSINFQQPKQQDQNQPPLTQVPSQEYSTINGQNAIANLRHQQVPSSEPPRQFNNRNHNSPAPHQNNNYNNDNNNYNDYDNNFNRNPTNHNNQQQFQNNNQNAFNFQAQPQEHQLHSLQRQPNYYQQQMQQFFPSPQPHHQPQAQPSNNFPLQVPLPFQQQQPPRFQVRPDPQQFAYSTIRHKRGYRHRLSSLLRGLRWRERD